MNDDSDRESRLNHSAFCGAAMFGDLDLLMHLLPQVHAASHADALGELVNHASVVGRNDVEPPLSTGQITYQTGIMRQIAAALIDADAGVPPVKDLDDHRVGEAVDHIAAIAGILPVAGVVGWIWSHRMADACGDYPAVAAYAAGQPLGLAEPQVAEWAARRAAEAPHEAWAMRLLAALGVAS